MSAQVALQYVPNIQHASIQLVHIIAVASRAQNIIRSRLNVMILMNALPIVLHVITPARILLAVINVVVEKDLNFMKAKCQNIII